MDESKKIKIIDSKNYSKIVKNFSCKQWNLIII